MKLRALVIASLLALTSLFQTSAQAAPQLSIGIAYDIGGPGDRSYNDAALAGLQKASKKFSIAVDPVVTDGTSSDREKRLRSLIAKGCNPIIAVGGGYAPTIQLLAIEFPDTHFAILNDASVDALNVTSIVFANTQGAYLAGYSAALVSKSGKVAMIADPRQADIYQNGFVAGVLAAKNKVKPLVKYVNGSSVVSAKQAMDAGADILYVTTVGSDSDLFSAVVARNTAKKKPSNFHQVGVISVEPDQYITVTPVTKKYLIASVIKRVDKAMYDVIAMATTDSQYLDTIDSTAGIYGHRYSITGGGIEFATYSSSLIAKQALINAAAATAEKIQG